MSNILKRRHFRDKVHKTKCFLNYILEKGQDSQTSEKSHKVKIVIAKFIELPYKANFPRFTLKTQKRVATRGFRVLETFKAGS